MARDKGNRVDVVHPQVQADRERHELAAALRRGVRRMRELALKWKYVRPNPGELELVKVGGDQTSSILYDADGHQVRSNAGRPFTVYELRIERTSMPNPWKNTIEDTACLPFRERIQLSGWDESLEGRVDEETGEKIVKGWIDDIDGEGRSLDAWAAEVFEDCLFDGVVYAIVDNDPREFPDAASRRRAGARPYVTKFNRDDVRRITIDRAPGGTPRVKQLVVDQPQSEIDVSNPDSWVDDARPALKVFTAGDEARKEPVRTRVYVQNSQGQFVEDPDLAGTIRPERPEDKLWEIPVVPFYGRRLSAYRGESPYLDSADTQAGVFAQMSELLNKAREASLSYVHESGVMSGEEGGTAQPVNEDTRSLRYRWTTNPQGKLTIAEHSGEVLKELRELVDWLCETIRSEHNRIESSKPTAPVTAREITLEGVHASSALEMMILFQEGGWQRVLELLTLLGGLSSRGTVSIPKDFGLPNAGMARNMQIYVAGGMHHRNYYEQAFRAGDIDEAKFDMKLEDERAGSPSFGAPELERTFEDDGEAGAVERGDRSPAEPGADESAEPENA